MAYDRYDTRRDRERGRYSDWDRDRGTREDRGFFERAGDEIASWFGDDEAERRRREDERMGRDPGYDRTYGRDFDRDRYAYRGYNRDYGRSYGPSGQRSARDYDRLGYRGQEHDLSYRGGMGGTTNPDYMSATGPSFGYGGTYGAGTSRGYGSGEFGREFEGQGYRRNESRDDDHHYHAWRQRQLDELDRDYDRYNRERQERFENDFGSWRQNRLSKRQQLNAIREHMDVVGSDGETIGKVDCVRGDHIVLTKSDSPDNRHHAIDCSMIETVEGDQIRLDMPAEEAKSRWEDADNRGFFGRDENEETNLNRSFAGTYER